MSRPHPAQRSAARRERRPPVPLDAAALEQLALHYVGRYATSRGKLAAYLARKLRERGWAGDEPADPAGVAARMAASGYVDDGGWAAARADALARRGLGQRRVALDWRAAGIAAEDAAALAPDVAARAGEAALAWARRRRVGPFAAQVADRDAQRRQFAAMLRAGHAPDLVRRILAAPPGSVPELDG